VHCIDTLRYILGDEVESVAVQAQYDSHSVLEASALGMIRFSRGTLASMEVSGRALYQTLIEIVGEDGVLSGLNALNVERPTTLELRRGYEVIERREVFNCDAYTLQVDAFARAIEEGRDFEISGEEGLRNQLVLDAAFRSITTGKIESVERPEFSASAL